jgi:ElaB/YqjD/DUF883 family membrane-anchored ribosome-binding protein
MYVDEHTAEGSCHSLSSQVSSAPVLNQENSMEVTPRSNTPFPPGNGGTDPTLSNASASVHAAVNSIAGAADVAAGKIKPAIEQVAAMAHQAVDKAAGAAAPTADWLAAKADSLNATQKKLVSDTCGYVSANPMKAIGIALVAGLLLGRITR